MKAQRQNSAPPHVAVCVDKSRSYGRGVLQGVADYLEQVAPWSIHVKHDDASQFSEEWIRRWKGDGIIAYVSNHSLAQKLSRSKIPVVDVAGLVEIDELSQVVADDGAIGRLAGEHFLERQFRNFAFVGPGDVLPDELRFAGFVNCVGTENCVRYLHPRHGTALSAWEKEQRNLSRFLQTLPKPVGLMAYSDIQARDVLDACDRAGLSVPGQVAVVGVDNDQELCRLSRVPLSSVASNPRRIGYMAAQLISRMIKGEAGTHPSHRIVVPPLYVVTRFSSDVTAVDDAYVARALTFIQRHAGDPIGIADVARAVELPRRSLYRRFASTLKRTPHEELQRARFERVRRLLTETDLSIDEVAEHSGFQSASYLCNCFKREYGITPSDFRESHKNKQGI